MKFKNKASGYKKAYRHRFTLLLLSVLISVVGTQMTDFALGVWLYESTKSAMLFSLLSFATIAPMTFCSPLIGILVDRFNHRHLMIAGHLGAGIGSLLMAGLYYYGLLQPWCLILLSAISSCFLGVLFPSFTASLIHLVPQEQLTRAQGLLNGADGLIRISAPPLAGILYAQLGLVVILAVDLISFTIAIALLCLITLERRSQEDSSLAVTTSVIDNSRLAWRYLINKPGLLPLFGLMAVFNYCFGTTITSMTPLVLTLKDSQTLGFILSCAGLGSLFGSLFILRYATTQRAVPWILRFTLLCAGAIFLSSFQNYVPLLMLLSCVIGFGFAVSITCYQSLLVRKIHPDIQGRVLGLRGVIEGGSFPLGNLVAGSIVDYFEPMMQPGGALAGTVGLMIGTGPGRGAGLLIGLAGLLLIASTLVAMFNPSIKRLEARLPNYGFTNEQKEDY